MNRSLTRNAAYNVAYSMLNVVFPLISAAYIARVLAPEGVGKTASVHNNMSYFLMFATLGIPRYGTREIAKRQDSQKEKNVLFSELVIANAILTAVSAVAYYAFIRLLRPSDAQIYYVFGLELLFNFINIDWFYQGEEEYVYITRRNILVKLLSLFALFLFVKDPDDCTLYALILCLGVGGNHLFNIFHARKRVRFVWHGLNLKQHLRPVLILMVSGIAAGLYNRVDITILGWLATDTAVGFYTNAHKVISLILGLITAMSAVLFPRLSYAYQHDRSMYQRYVSNGVKIVLMLAVPGCLGLILVADLLCSVMFGAAFEPAAMTLRILAVFTIIKGVGDILCYQAVLSSGNEEKLIKSRVYAGLANVVLNAILIPKFAHNGAAVASVVSELIVNGMLLRYALTIVKPDISKKFYISLTFSSLTMGAAVTVLRYFVQSTVPELIVSVAVGIMAFAVMMVLLKNEIAEEIRRNLKI